jgi:hypothetical protein
MCFCLGADSNKMRWQHDIKTPKTCVRPTPQIISKVSAGFTNSAEFATIHRYSTDLVVIHFPKVVTVHTKFSTDHTKVSNVHPKFDKKCHVQFISPQFFKHWVSEPKPKEPKTSYLPKLEPRPLKSRANAFLICIRAFGSCSIQQSFRLYCTVLHYQFYYLKRCYTSFIQHGRLDCSPIKFVF